MGGGAVSQPVKLNLCSGPQQIPGWTNVDAANGGHVYPLAWGPDSIDEIRCSHGLEHFPQNDVPKVLADWVRALKPGGSLKVAVPDFAFIAKAYMEGQQLPLGSFLLGGQQNELDFHKSIYDEHNLRVLLEGAGLVQIEHWESEINDCARYPLSLNLKGYKPVLRNCRATLQRDYIGNYTNYGLDGPGLECGRPAISDGLCEAHQHLARPSQAETLEVKAKVAALMSVPRLGWQDNFGACQQALKDIHGVDIPLWRVGGVFWEQCMQRGLNALIKDGVEWIITIDYDTIFERADVIELLTLAALYPEADCIVPLQAKRSSDIKLFTMRDSNGKLRERASFDEFDGDLTPIHTGHFGLTLIKTAALKRMPKPWFWNQPTENGEWDEGRIDADIYFWQKAQAHGLGVFQANKVRLGHLQLVVSWVDKNFEVCHQYLPAYTEQGKPESVK